MIKGQTLIRAFLWASAGVALSGAYAKADNFDFSFTGYRGTVTGEIFGLTNNTATQAATEVLILTYPAAFDPFTNLDVTTWSTPEFNEFTESGGAITYVKFAAWDSEWNFQLIGGTTPGIVLGYLLNSKTNVFDYVSDNDETIALLDFTPAAVPEPNALVLLSTMLLAVALVARKRIAHSR